MTITKNDFFSIKLNPKVIEKEHALWNQFISCNKKRELINFLSEINITRQWTNKIVNYTAENDKDHCSILKTLIVEMRSQNESLSEINFITNTEHKIKILQAIEVLSQNDAVMEYALRSFIGRILIVKCDTLIASSSVLSLGLIVISPKDNWTIYDYIENLIHEMSHIELYIKQLIDPLVLKGSYLKNPFRTHPRPANGVFHAAFVLARIIFHLNELRSEKNKMSIENINRASLLLGETIPQFERHDILTFYGKKIINEIKHILTNIQKQDAFNDYI